MPSANRVFAVKPGTKHLISGVGERRTKDHAGEAGGLMGRLELLLTRDFQSRILPVRIGAGRRLRNQIMCEWFLINTRRADEDVLPRRAAKQFDVATDV